MTRAAVSHWLYSLNTRLREPTSYVLRKSEISPAAFEFKDGHRDGSSGDSFAIRVD